MTYAMLYFVAAPEISSQGVHWANRYLLWIYPLLAITAVYRLERWYQHTAVVKSWRIAALLAPIAVSLMAQCYSIFLLHKKKDFSQRLNQVLQERSEKVVVTDRWWIAQEMHSIFYDKPILFVANSRQFIPLHDRLIEAGYQTYLLATQSDGPSGDWESVYIDDAGLQFFSLYLYRLPVRSENSAHSPIRARQSIFGLARSISAPQMTPATLRPKTLRKVATDKSPYAAE